MFEETAEILKKETTNRVSSRGGSANITQIESAITHGLGRIPNRVMTSARTNGLIAYESKSPDRTRIYLKANKPGSIYWQVS